MDKVDESVTNIALGLQIHGKIEVVILLGMSSVDHFKEGHLLELIRNVSDHDGGSRFFSSQDPVEVNVVVLILV